MFRLDQIIDPECSLHNIQDKNCKELACYMQLQGYNYELGVMTVLFLKVQSPWAPSIYGRCV